jgi:ketosteroid isomerase-like protein
MTDFAAPGAGGASELLTSTHDGFCAALASGDARAAAAAYAPGAWLLPPSGEPIHGRHLVEAFWRAGIGAGVSAMEFQRSGLHVDGGVALEVGEYVLRLAPPDGSEVVERGVYLQVHQRQVDGSWTRLAESLQPATTTA